MATLEQVAQELLTSQQTMLAMRQQFDAELRSMRDQVEAASAARTAVPQAEVRSIDSRVLGKPEPFDGQTGWRDWSTVFRAYCGACNRDLEQLMARAEISVEATLNVNMDADEAGMSSQLYYMLVMICKSSALTRVVNAGPGEGLEAWRSLVLYREPSSQTRSAGLLLELLAYDFEGDVSGKLVAFERDIFRYEQSSKEKFPDSIKIGTLLRRLPEGPLRQHLLLNSARLTGWASMRDEVENLRRAQLASASGPMPMDVSALEGEMAAFNVKGKGGKSGKGKGFTKNYGAKDNVPSDACGVCGKIGALEEGLLVQRSRVRQGQVQRQGQAEADERERQRRQRREEVLELRRDGPHVFGVQETEEGRQQLGWTRF